MNLVDDAFNACSTGIRKAQDQCLSVMGALGTVYHHARDVLDRINPDRWSSKQPQQQQQQHQHQQQMTKRQVLFKDGRCDHEIHRCVLVPRIVLVSSRRNFETLLRRERLASIKPFDNTVYERLAVSVIADFMNDDRCILKNFQQARYTLLV